MPATRIETSRPHQRTIGSYELGPNGGPFTTKTLSSGKPVRADYRGFPNFVGVNEWWDTTEAAP